MVEDSTPDLVDGQSAQTTPRSIQLPSSKSAGSSRRGSALLPSQQSCEVDDDALTNENSLMTELMQVQQLSVSHDSQNIFIIKLFQRLDMRIDRSYARLSLMENNVGIFTCVFVPAM